jgi:hypothetical protein
VANRVLVVDNYARRLRPTILYVHHRGTGGTAETNADLMGALLDDYEPCLLTSDTKVLELSGVGADAKRCLRHNAVDHASLLAGLP